MHRNRYNISKHKPHQGAREMARRAKQQERTLGEALEEALDEILEEAEEPDCDDGPRAWERIYGLSNPDGTVTACVSTNDNLDTGYPSEFAEWTTRIKEEFHRRYGKSRTGCSGVEVEVFLDGKQL